MTSFRERGLALIANGYQIIPIPARTKAPIVKAWENIRADKPQVERWSANGYARGSIGMLTRRNPGLDLDILDLEVVKEMQRRAERIVGSPLPMLMRIGRAPKRLLLFCTAEPFPKVASPFFMSPDGKKHRVEVLADGQQFVAFGIHPDTGKEFEWVSESNPLNTPIDELPSLSYDQARRIVAEFVALAEERGWKRVALAFKGSFDEIANSEPNGIDMRPKLRVTADDVSEALKLLDGFDDYETWVRVGMGLHHQFDGSEEALNIWLDWSAQWDAYIDKGGEEAARYRWGESFKQVRDGGHGPITVAFIIKHANQKRREHEEAAFNELQGKVANALDFKTLIGPVAKNIAETELSPMQRNVLTKLMQKAAKKFTGVNLSLKDVAATTKPRATDEPGKVSRTLDELEVTLARRVLRTRFEDGAHIKRFNKMWWTYQEGVWRREEDEFIERCVLETLTDLRHINDKMLRDLLGKMDESRGDRLNSLVATVASVMSKLVAEQGNNDPLGLNSFDAPRVINCTNCEVWIDDNGGLQVLPHNPVHNLTSQIACEYEPQATCPTWDTSVSRVFQEFREPEAMIRHFYEVLGYVMQPSREQAVWILIHGPGDNGKSFLIGVISEIMGGSVIAQSVAEIGTKTSSHFTTALLGKLMLLDDDLNTHTLLPDGWLKKLSEAKLLSADPKFGQTFEFIARAIPVILTNPWPSTADLSEGLRRRVQVFDLLHTLTDAEKDPNHLRTIRAFELPGILLHLVGGMQRFLARGGKFDPPAECLEAKARWLSSSNTTMRFVEECVERVTKRSSVRASDMYEHYTQWLRFWETNAKPLGRNKFYEAMDALRLKRTSHAHVTYYAYVKLKPLDVGFNDLDAEGDDGLGGDGL